jgi:(1->4)-alpha-D-glucan 1-alpha-D-glucosylmutase
MNALHKAEVDGKPAPDGNDEYLFYQILLGIWTDGPTEAELESLRERVLSYMLKATREAKVHTSWVNPNEAYEAAVEGFVTGALDNDPRNLFMKDFPALQQRVAFYGRLNALAQLLLKMTSPGVPDFYQGTELWNYRLVDPDNRRPVDYNFHRTVLSELKKREERAGSDLASLTAELLGSAQDGRIKLYATCRVLSFRRTHHELFSNGDYFPLEVLGEKLENVCAFGRSLRQETVIIAVPRLVVRLTGGVEQIPVGQSVWRDTRLLLPGNPSTATYRNLFTGEVLTANEYEGKPALLLSDVFQTFPGAFLERVG